LQATGASFFCYCSLSDLLKLLPATLKVDHVWLLATTICGDLHFHAALATAETLSILWIPNVAFVSFHSIARLAHLVCHVAHCFVPLEWFKRKRVSLQSEANSHRMSKSWAMTSFKFAEVEPFSELFYG
jgi:hypothetical protein